MTEEKKKLKVNCGLALLLNDREGMLDNYDNVSINCGKIVISSAINAKLSAKGAKINCGTMHIHDITGEIIQLDKGAVIDGRSNFKDFFIIAKDDVIVTKDGIKNLAEAEGLIALGKIYYPESENLAALIKVSGERRAYPDDAQVILGNHKLENLMGNLKGDKKHIWVSGRLTALEKKALEDARSLGLIISCTKLFSFEGLSKEYASLLNCSDRILVPDGYEITGKINGGELPLYGKLIYVDGQFSMEEKDIPALEEIESIIVKGKASLPSTAVKTFRSKGKAEEYFIFEGRLVEINGFEQFSHNSLDASVKKGEKITLQVNGCLLFDDDVTADDVECIASLSYNGTVLVSNQAKAALTSKVKTGNGFMGDPAMMKELTGQGIKDLMGGKQLDDDSKDTRINMGNYILI